MRRHSAPQSPSAGTDAADAPVPDAVAEAADAADAPAPAVAYHRLPTLRPAWSGRGRPLLTLLAAFIAYVVLASILLVGTILVLALLPGVNIALGIVSGDRTSPLDVALALLMGALWLPAGVVGVRIGGWRPLATAWSVAARLRRELLGTAGAVTAVGGAIVVGAAALAGALGRTAPAADVDPAAAAGATADAADAAAASAGAPVAQLLAVIVIVLLIAPIQVMGLELTLRGAVLQAVGSRLRSPLVPVLAVAAVALIGRETTAAVLVPALVLALCAGVLAWKSGGLEIPIALTGSITVVGLIVAALADGTAAAAGVDALVAAAAAPGTSMAALHASDASAALAGGCVGALALLVLTAALVLVISRREGVGLLEPVRRAAGEPVPEPVLV
ncbi:CAAX protease [Brachybacterium sp. DNPG3]